MLFQPPLKSIKLEDIINYIDSDTVIIKLDIEGYECKALQPKNTIFTMDSREDDGRKNTDNNTVH